MKDALPKILFGFAVVAMSFAYGFLSYRFEIFPYNQIRNAYLAYSAIVEVAGEKLEMKVVDFWEETPTDGPLYQALAEDAGAEHIFVLGNERAHAEDDSDGPYLAWIADRDGNIVHAWRHPGEIWAPLTGREGYGDQWRSYPVGGEVLPNGDLLVSYHGVGVFPSAMGFARFDKDSNLLWKSDDYYHHWFSVGPDDEIYIPDLEFATSPVVFPDHNKTIRCDKIDFPYDSIAIVDKDGNKLREIDTFEAIIESDLTGLFNSNKEKPNIVETCDPMHLNEAQILTEEMAAAYPMFQAGDLLVSFRTLNMVGVMDVETERFKWHFVGPSHHQHSPRFLGDGRVVYFDNYGGAQSRGTTRILAVDVATNRYETVFPKPGNDLPDRPFISKTAGHVDVSDDGRRILVSWTHQGLVWEIDVETGEILWELVNSHPIGERTGRISVYTAKFVSNMNFVGNGGEISTQP